MYISGCMICFGRSNYFRFNNPGEARKMKEALPGCRVSCAPLELFQGKTFPYALYTLSKFACIKALILTIQEPDFVIFQV